jgi:hypothetical protein
MESFMFRSTFLASIALLPIVLSAAPASAPPTATPCPNTIRHEPLVLYDITGSTLAGPIDIGLTVYNDGTARISSTGQFGQPSKAATTLIAPEKAAQLLFDLASLGAGQLCDNLALVPDLPVSTLTILRDGIDSKSHTFSWVLPQAPYAAVQARMQDFIHSNFPNF